MIQGLFGPQGFVEAGSEKSVATAASYLNDVKGHLDGTVRRVLSDFKHNDGTPRFELPPPPSEVAFSDVADAITDYLDEHRAVKDGHWEVDFERLKADAPAAGKGFAVYLKPEVVSRAPAKAASSEHAGHSGYVEGQRPRVVVLALSRDDLPADVPLPAEHEKATKLYDRAPKPEQPAETYQAFSWLNRATPTAA